jgi:hypothetical protein
MMCIFYWVVFQQFYKAKCCFLVAAFHIYLFVVIYSWDFWKRLCICMYICICTSMCIHVYVYIHILCVLSGWYAMYKFKRITLCFRCALCTVVCENMSVDAALYVWGWVVHKVYHGSLDGTEFSSQPVIWIKWNLSITTTCPIDSSPCGELILECSRMRLIGTHKTVVLHTRCHI